jgi:uncharacterized membrane protein HdeD (DUF308 family)
VSAGEVLEGLHRDAPWPLLLAGIVGVVVGGWLLLKVVRFALRVGRWLAIASAVIGAITYIVEFERARREAREGDANEW